MTNIGILTFATREPVDYIRLAKLQAITVKANSKFEFAVVVPRKDIDYARSMGVFDHIIPMDHPGGWEAEHLAYQLSPFHETIKTDADMLWPRYFGHWLRTWRLKDLVVTSEVLDHRGNRVDDSYYRPFYVENNLPNLYSAITYFRKSKIAETFFKTLEQVTRNWTTVVQEFSLMETQKFSTDVAYSICSLLNGIDVTLPVGSKFVHLKPKILGIPSTSSWDECFVWSINTSVPTPTEDGKTRKYKDPSVELIIHGYAQYYPIHYLIKSGPTIEKFDGILRSIQ